MIGSTTDGSASHAQNVVVDRRKLRAADRDLRLAGYEVFRFGGQEIADRGRAGIMLDQFFDALLAEPPAT